MAKQPEQILEEQPTNQPIMIIQQTHKIPRYYNNENDFIIYTLI